MKKVLLVLLIVAALSVVLTACGNGTPPASTETQTETTAEDTTIGDFTLSVQAKGSGSIAYAPQGQTPVFNEKYPTTSAEIYLSGPSTYVLDAKPSEGAKFVKWTKDGKDYATDQRITVKVSQAALFVAVFSEP